MKDILMRLIGATLLAISGASLAQNETPAVEDMPLVNTEQPEPAAPAPKGKGAPAAPAQPTDGVHKAATGTTVVGEQESPIGLYITPWRNSAAAGGLDRPARLLDEALLPLDPDVFKRQVEYHRALSEHLSKTGRATP